MNVAETASVSKLYDGLTAVDSVDIRVRPGEVVGLLGANGAGKTTLIKMLLGLSAPSSGTVLLFGEPPSRRTRTRVGYVPQGLGLYDDLTVRENLAFVARAFGNPSPAMHPADPGIAGSLDRTVGQLPLGLRRRTAFAAALSHSPELLMLDEPTSGVDALARAELWSTIRASAEGGAGVLVSTHYPEEAENCDRLVLMHEGRVVADGSLSDIIGGRTTVRVVVQDWRLALRALDEADAPVGLSGTELRVPGAREVDVARILRGAGIAASISIGPATFEETFVLLEHGSSREPAGGSQP